MQSQRNADYVDVEIRSTLRSEKELALPWELASSS